MASAVNPALSHRPFPAALWLPQDSFDYESSHLNGRRVAGVQFLWAVTDHLTVQERLHISCPEEAGRYQLRNRFGQIADRIILYPDLTHQHLAQIGCLHLADPSIAVHAKRRLPLREADYSITGVIHTLCSRSAIESISDCVASDLYPWDALICSSTCGREVVHQIWRERLDFLARRFSIVGIQDSWMPQTPVIPLPGPRHQLFEPGLPRHQRRLKARQHWGIASDAFVVCTVGRLSFSSKAHPIPLYRALAELASDLERPLLLIECGAYPSPEVKATYEELADSFPGFQRFVVGGDSHADELDKFQVYAAADVFVSLADSIQETFGLTILEAMSAELPVVVSDWDGYRDLVVPGVTGELVPTSDVLPVLRDDRMQVGFYAEQLDYDRWVGVASLGVVVDHDLIVAHLRGLAASPARRERLACAGLIRYNSEFAPNVVISHYRRLWQELAEIRCQALSSTIWRSGRTPAMGRLFRSYATRPFTPASVELLDPGRLDQLLRVGLGIWFGRLLFGGSSSACLDRLRSEGQLTLEDLSGLGYSDTQSRRIMTLLVKFGLARTILS